MDPNEEQPDGSSDNQERTSQKGAVHLFNTKLSDGRSGLLLDIGSVGNLMSYGWAKVQAVLAAGQGYMAKYRNRKTPLNVSGVGHGHQSCKQDGQVPICLADIENKRHLGTFEAPLIDGDMPALMGRLSLQRMRAIINTVNNKVYFLGPGDYREALQAAMPPGARVFQAEISSSGHMMLPCAAYKSGTTYNDDSGMNFKPKPRNHLAQTGALGTSKHQTCFVID